MDDRNHDEQSDPRLALIQAFVALALLIGLPIVLEPPTTPWGVGGLVTASLLLMIFFAEGVVRFVRSRRRPFHDSIIPPEIEQADKKKKVDE